MRFCEESKASAFPNTSATRRRSVRSIRAKDAVDRVRSAVDRGNPGPSPVLGGIEAVLVPSDDFDDFGWWEDDA